MPSTLAERLLENLPRLSQQDSEFDPIVFGTFKSPDLTTTWYVTEGELCADGDILCFGFVDDQEPLWGYFMVSDLVCAQRGGPVNEWCPLDSPKRFSEVLRFAMEPKTFSNGDPRS